MLYFKVHFSDKETLDMFFFFYESTGPSILIFNVLLAVHKFM